MNTPNYPLKSNSLLIKCGLAAIAYYAPIDIIAFGIFGWTMHCSNSRRYVAVNSTPSIDIPKISAKKYNELLGTKFTATFHQQDILRNNILKPIR